MSHGDLSSDRGGQSPATSDFASAFATGLVLGGGRDDDDDDVYFGDEEETEFTNGLGGTSCNDSDDEEGLLTGGGGGGDDDDSDDDMFSKTYTSDRGSNFERHDSMQSAQSEAVKQYAEEKGLGSEKTSFRAALLKKRQTRHNANASTNSGTASPGGLNNSISAGAAFNRLREQQQLQTHQQQIHQLRHGGVAGGIDGVHAAALLGASGGGGDIHRVSSLSGASNASSNTSSRLAVTSGLSPYSTPGSHQRHHPNTSSQNGTVPYHHHKHNQSFPTHPATLLHHNHQHHHNNTLSNPASGAASNSTTPASISPRQDVVLPGTPLTLISTADGASPRGGGTHGGPMTAIIDSQDVGGFRVAVAAMAGPGEDSESDEEATMVDALTTPLIDNNMGMIADLLRREGAPPILQATTTAATTPTMEATLTTMGVQDRHLNFRSCAFEGEEYDAFYNHHQSCLRDGGIAPAYKPLSLSRVSSNLPTPDMSHHHLSSGSSPSPNSDPHLFGNAQVLPGVVALQLSSPDPNAHHHIRTSSQDNQTRGNELLQSTMQCPPTTSFPPNSTVVVGCTLKQLRRVQGPLHYTPLFAALFAVGSGGGVAPRGTVVRHTGDYTLVRFKNLPTVNVAPISTHSHLHLSGSINGSSTLVHPQRGLWPHIDSTYHPLNTVLTPQQRSELMDNLDEDMLLDRTHSVHIDHSSTLVGGENGTDSPPHHHPNHHHSSSTNKYPAMLSVEQQHTFMEAWSTNRDQRQRLRSEIIKRSASTTTSNHDDDAGSSVTCEFTIHRSCLSLLSSA